MTAFADSLAAGILPIGAARGRADMPVAMEMVTDAVWESLIAEFDGVCQEQLLTFARRRWPGVRQEPLVFSAGGEIVGGSLMMIQRLPFGIGAIAVAKWGPMLRRTQRADAMAVYEGMIERLVEEYAVKRRMMVSVLPRASLSDRNPEFDHLMADGHGATDV